MDFLDQKAKKRRNFRLMTGYILVFCMIITASLILVFSAYGFDINRKTGEVIQNGLLYVDSAPDGAEVYINGSLHKDKTEARMSLPEGIYTVEIKKSGYRDFSRTFNIEGGEVERVTYPYLVPTQIESSRVDTLGMQNPQVRTQSPDRRWLLVSTSQNYLSFNEYDLNEFNQDTSLPAKSTIAFPAEVFSTVSGKRNVVVEEWSRDNRNFLIKHTFGDQTEYIILNRDKPEESVNINKLLGVNPDKVSLNDKKSDRWYIYFKENGILQRADKTKRIESVLEKVITYETFGSETIVYASQHQTSKDLAEIFIYEKDQSYSLKKVQKGSIKLNISQYDDHRYVAIASEGDQKTYVYKDPINTLKDEDGAIAVPISILKASGIINDLKFSANAQFLMARSGQNIRIFDAEEEERYAFVISSKIDKGSQVEWMDGHRIMFNSSGKISLINFEGVNFQELVDVSPGESAFFDRDYARLYTINKLSEDKRLFGVFVNHMRIAADR